VVVGMVPDGEEYKNLEQLQALVDVALDHRLDRGCLVMPLGGGVIGDLGGFLAAVYQRGVDFVHVPTTLLAQVDSSVGGKVGVNHPRAKNMIGAFHQPRAVFTDPLTLRTLAPREFAAGLAEVVKYGIIMDAEFFSYLEDHAEELLGQDPPVLEEVIYRCCRSKARIVEMDETERGVRTLLNLGHTLGHAVESLTGYRRYLHGEAVALGTIAACRIAAERGMMSFGEADRVRALLERFGLPVRLPALDPERVLEAMAVDKKVRDGRLRFVLPRGIGEALVVDDVEDETVRQLFSGQETESIAVN
ncbi:MAG: 3-dehydroquinate synthase, partial [Syntrophomonadaceae bacterium]|nr:3-dehydroquinate synthase [Syntrophomonadaceae bacterium]